MRLNAQRLKRLLVQQMIALQTKGAVEVGARGEGSPTGLKLKRAFFGSQPFSGECMLSL